LSLKLRQIRLPGHIRGDGSLYCRKRPVGTTALTSPYKFTEKLPSRTTEYSRLFLHSAGEDKSPSKECRHVVSPIL
jgi:hypothetical protein